MTVIGVMGDTFLVPKITVGNHTSNVALHALGATANESSDMAETSVVLEEFSLEVVISRRWQRKTCPATWKCTAWH